MFGNLFNQKKYIVQDQQQNIQQTPPQSAPADQAVVPQSTPQQPAPMPNSNDNGTAPVSVSGSTMQPATREDLSALTHLDPRSTQVLNLAQQETVRIKQEHIEPEQIFFGLLFDGEVFQLLEQFSLKVATISRDIQAKEKEGTFQGQPTFSQSSKQTFEQALLTAKNRGASFIMPEDILVALLAVNASLASYLQSQGLDKKSLDEKLSKMENFNLNVKKSILDIYGVDLTEQARKGVLDPVAARDREMQRMIHILLRRIKNNPIIIGEAGVGKTAIVEGLAQMIAQGNVPKELQNKRIIQIDVASLVAGASHRGEFEERLRNVIKEAQVSGGKVILFIDEIHTLIGAGGDDSSMNASNIIKPFLARGQLQIIGSTTTLEYRKYFEKDKAFERRFQTVLCEEPSEEGAIEMINVLKSKYEAFHKVTLTPEAVEASVKLSKRYIGERYLPDKAVDLLDEASAEVRLQTSAGKRADSQVTKSDIEKIISSWTGIPVSKLTESESEKLLHLEDTIHKRLINQTVAVTAVAEAVRRGRIGLASAQRPIASFIFLGPTGVGKTELAKTLAEILFGKEEAMTRLDMSEYMEKHEVSKLIGAPPGYVGYEEGGQLTEAVRIKPYSVVLLDEVEKAHPDVFNILLQLLEDGRLTDNKGNTISFKNTIIIATSNIGSGLIQQTLMEQAAKEELDESHKTEEEKKKEEELEQKEEAMKATLAKSGASSKANAKQEETKDATGKVIEKTKEEKEIEEKQAKLKELYQVVLGELHKFFKPELLNRFDEVIIFEPLGRKNMYDIAKLRIDATRKLLKEQNIGIDISDKALKELAREGYDPVYGARPLRRLVQTAIENPIASLILAKTYSVGDTIQIDYDGIKEMFVFNKKAKELAQDIQKNIQSGQNNSPAANTEDAQHIQSGMAQAVSQTNQVTPDQSIQTQNNVQSQASVTIPPSSQPANEPYKIVLQIDPSPTPIPIQPTPAGAGTAIPLTNSAENAASSS